MRVENALNMKRAVWDAGLTVIGCFANGLNLCTKDALDTDSQLRRVQKKL